MKKILNIKKYKWLLLVIFLLVARALFVKTTYFENPICPNNFENIEKRTAEFQKWTDTFYRKNPSASTKETIEFRRDFLAKNNCEEALKINDFYITTDGKVVEEITETEGAIREEMFQSQNKICPNEYENRDDYIKAVGQWLRDFYDKNPNATKDEVLSARENFITKNRCK